VPDGNRYQDVGSITREQAEQALRSGSPEARTEALLSLAYHDRDWEWVQERCIQSAHDEDPGVRGMAALCFGHLARIHRQLNLDRVLPVLHGLQKDPEVAWRVNDALDDIEVFLGRR
jgi:HEAT repeat protein